MNEKSSFLTTPLAILLSSFVITVAILLHGGIITVGSPAARGGTAAAPAAAQPQAQPQAAKTEADIVSISPTIKPNNANYIKLFFS